ncbi:DUF7490 domain-containing protein [Candidatus Methanoperedens nitratireducens]|uniref:DUF7490 domain-containing protein n=1 Tax=Candidatus Methanoperedens nitratireducens TaxID=1392998 RepID=A0A284VLP0_9EURY|nr:hypothetical protein [Candidatus Methanoperedens nitroreducens]SNQ60200.1 conserved hypothetical protein [Candidatus Methanoperedens nitroreducens]
MKHTKFLFLIFIFGSLIFSGCLKEYDNVMITSVDVMSSPQADGTKLTITPYVQNNQNTDTGILTLQVKIREPSTNLIVAEKNSDIGYIKSKSSYSNSVSLTVSNPGEYGIEVQVLEGAKILAQYSTPVNVRATPGPGQPADIKLTDMNLVITKFVNDATSAVVEISPGIYNQGGDSQPLTVEVTARVDPYTAYTQSDELGVVKSTNRVRGKISFVLPRNKEYSFSMNVIESGKTIVTGNVNEKVKLNNIKFNTPMTYVIIEEGKPIATPKEPGFGLATALIGILLVYGIRMRNKGRSNER